MFPFHPFASAAGGNHHSGGVQVPAGASLPPAPSVDPAQLTQAERAARALDEDGRARPVSVDRAFLESALDVGRTLRTLRDAAKGAG